MGFRHEWKHEVNAGDALALHERLSAIMSHDSHAHADGTYRIRSLYFDTFQDTALRDKLAGVSRREKFRIRYYDDDLSYINLEKKEKINNLCLKTKAHLSARQAQAIVDGDTDWLICSSNPLLQELYCKMHIQGLRPKTIVDYTREAFVFPAGNVRVTIDSDIRTGVRSTAFLDQGCPTIAAGDAPIVLEVKWDEFLPSHIRDAVQLPQRRTAAFSKYAASRIYG